MRLNLNFQWVELIYLAGPLSVSHSTAAKDSINQTPLYKKARKKTKIVPMETTSSITFGHSIFRALQCPLFIANCLCCEDVKIISLNFYFVHRQNNEVYDQIDGHLDVLKYLLRFSQSQFWIFYFLQVKYFLHANLYL